MDGGLSKDMAILAAATGNPNETNVWELLRGAHPKSIDVGENQVALCERCTRAITNSHKVPPQYLYIEEDPAALWLKETNQAPLTIVEILLTSPLICKIQIVKLQSWGNPSHAQRGTKGCCITFPQSNSALQTTLPLKADDIGLYLKVVFVGDTPPAEKVLKALFRVRRAVVHRVIELRQGHPAYANTSYEAVDLPVDGIPPGFESTFTTEVDLMEYDGSYVNIGDVDLTEPTMATNGVVDVDGANFSVHDVWEHLLVDQSHPGKDRIDVSQKPIIGCVESQTMGFFKQAPASDKKHRHGDKPAIISVAPSGNQPVNTWFNPAFWTSLFPHLFPQGIGGAEEESQRGSFSLQAWARNLLLRTDNRWAVDPSFLFVVYQVLQRREVARCTKAMVKKKSFAALTADFNALTPADAKAALHQIKDAKLQGAGHTNPSASVQRVKRLMAHIQFSGGQVKGSDFEKAKFRHQIHAIMISRGQPLFFITVNPADLHSPLFLYMAGKVTDLGPLKDEFIKVGDRAKAVAENPVACARFFNTIIRNFLKNLLRPIGGPAAGPGLLGNCDGYYGTVESQGRGSLHLHLLCWIIGLPDPNTLLAKLQSEGNFAGTFLDYLSQCIQQSFPDHGTGAVSGGVGPDVASPGTDTSPPNSQTTHPSAQIIPNPAHQTEIEAAADLTRILLSCNMHGKPDARHNACCYKYGSCACRFHFPRKAEEASIALESGQLIIRLNRNEGCQWLNNFNSAIALAARCNHDIQVVIGGAEGVSAAYYICDYITKKMQNTYNGIAMIAAALDKFEKQKSYSGTAQETERVREEFHSELTPAQNNARLMVMKCINQMVTQSERSGPDIATHLLGLPMTYTNFDFENCYLKSLSDLVARTVGVPLPKPHKPATEKENSTSDSGVTSISDGTGPPHIVAPKANPPPHTDPSEDEDSNDINITGGSNENDNPPRTMDDELSEMMGSLGSMSSDRERTCVSHSEHYLHRHASLSAVSVYDFAAWFKLLKIDKNASVTKKLLLQPAHPQALTHYLSKHRSPVIPVLVGTKVPSHKQRREEFYFTVCVLLLPWNEEILQHWPKHLSGYEEHYLHHTNGGFDMDDSSTQALRHRRVRRIVANLITMQEGKAGQRERKRAKAAGTDEQFDDTYGGIPMEEFGGDSHAFLPTQKLEDILPVADRKIGMPVMNSKERDYMEGLGNVLLPSVSLPSATNLDARSWEHKPSAKLDRRSLAQLKSNLKAQQKLSLAKQSRSSLESKVDESSNKPEHSLRWFADHHKLTGKQRLAFVIMGHTFLLEMVKLRSGGTEPVEQLKMYTGGAGGTGKSFVIKAFLHLLEYHGMSHLVRVCAYTGSAASVAGGTTIAYLMADCQMDSKKHGHKNMTKSRLQTLEFRVGSCAFLIIDEISMVSGLFLNKLNGRLQTAKGNAKMMGGVHFIFFGDFHQYPPISMCGKPLYDQMSKWCKKASHRELETVSGNHIWKSLNSCVMLAKNYRHKDDPGFGHVLNTMREGGEPAHIAQKMVFKTKNAAFDIINSRILKKRARLELSLDSPFITSRNSVRHAFTLMYIHKRAHKLNTPPLVITSRDSLKNNAPLPLELRRRLLQLNDNQTKGQMGYLVLLPAMPLILRHNLYVTLGLFNGSTGTLYDIVFHDKEPPIPKSGIRPHYLQYMPKALLIHFRDAKFAPLPGLPPGVCPIQPQTMYTIYPKQTSAAHPNQHKWNRHQFTVSAGWCLTGYFVQGRTLQSGIIDLRPPPTGKPNLQDPYVFLSRFKQTQQMTVVAPFPKKVLDPQFGPDFKANQLYTHDLCRDTRTVFNKQFIATFSSLPIPLFRSPQQVSLPTTTTSEPKAGIHTPLDNGPAGKEANPHKQTTSLSDKEKKYEEATNTPYSGDSNTDQTSDSDNDTHDHHRQINQPPHSDGGHNSPDTKPRTRGKQQVPDYPPGYCTTHRKCCHLQASTSSTCRTPSGY